MSFNRAESSLSFPVLFNKGETTADFCRPNFVSQIKLKE